MTHESVGFSVSPKRQSFEISYTTAKPRQSGIYVIRTSKAESIKVTFDDGEVRLRGGFTVPPRTILPRTVVPHLVYRTHAVPDSLSGVPWATLPDSMDGVEEREAEVTPSRAAVDEPWRRSLLRGAARVLGGRVRPRRVSQTPEERVEAALMRFSAAVNGRSRDGS
jgi:hypothetical protein